MLIEELTATYINDVHLFSFLLVV